MSEPTQEGRHPADVPTADAQILAEPGPFSLLDPRYCDRHSFSGRFQQSLYRADRNDRQVLLLLVRVDITNSGAAPGAGSPQRLLKLTRYRIGSCLRRGDTLADFGDGLFAILLEEVRDASAVPMAIEKIHAALSHPFHIERSRIKVAFCTGASLFPIDGFLCSQLWSQARAALDLASQTGHGTFSFSPIMMGHAAMDGFAMSRDLHAALQADQFGLVYQPVFDASGTRVLGLEALLRWVHPLEGMLPPEHFLSVLEDTGLIIPVGEQVIRDACRLAKRLHDDGHSAIRVAVNVSARQFADAGFLLSVLDALYESGTEPSLLELELSEETLLQDTALSQRQLQELRNSGVHITIDRFGAGLSSLAEVVRLPFSGVKVDHELVRKLPEDQCSAAVAAGVFALAQGAGVTVSAAGIENRRQLDFLRARRCDRLQGHYFSRPMPADELMHWLPN